MLTDKQAFVITRLGYIAFENGVGLESNPYKPNTEQWGLWVLGWDYADLDRDERGCCAV